ncbi:hypothetical protein Patl1_33010 [Pistacia atlantica]|uniref:Uncharacterized protein n=1 Tax=Pistacia atlantica TaxID=434234 RepID=A0ACC1AM53_9ROSI|nr:hypothetical protein Patl1_33010 [Pistacia atlantica]
MAEREKLEALCQQDQLLLIRKSTVFPEEKSTKVVKASLMAERVKLMMIYGPWSSPCSDQIELEVQKTLKVIRFESTEDCLFPDESQIEFQETWIKYIQIFREIESPSYYDQSPVFLKNIDNPVWVQAPGESARALYSDKVISGKLFDCVPEFGKSPKTRLVVWHPPFPSWIKVNTDGLSKGNPGLSACGGVFRSDSCDFLGGFAVSLGAHSAYYAELMAVFLAIHIAHSNGWRKLWLESDCLIVVRAIQSRKLDPPTQLRKLWNDCLRKIDSMNIYCSHIYREGNRVADELANLGLKYHRLQWWENPPMEIQELLLHDFWGLPNYRFC